MPAPTLGSEESGLHEKARQHQPLPQILLEQKQAAAAP
jgi:hypothetical protein